MMQEHYCIAIGIKDKKVEGGGIRGTIGSHSNSVLTPHLCRIAFTPLVSLNHKCCEKKMMGRLHKNLPYTSRRWENVKSILTKWIPKPCEHIVNTSSV